MAGYSQVIALTLWIKSNTVMVSIFTYGSLLDGSIIVASETKPDLNVG